MSSHGVIPILSISTRVVSKHIKHIVPTIHIKKDNSLIFRR